MDQTRFSTNNFTNYRKLISLADHDWETAQTGKIAGLNVEIENTNQMIDQYGRSFHHFCTTSYLGLDHHPALLEGAMSTLRETGTLRVANSKNRCKLTILEQYETELSELFGANCLSALTCSSTRPGVLTFPANCVFPPEPTPLICFFFAGCFWRKNYGGIWNIWGGEENNSGERGGGITVLSVNPTRRCTPLIKRSRASELISVIHLKRR